MRIDALKLQNFRNYDALDVAFAPDCNVIVGENAQGKTNLLEAIVYLSSARSPRARAEKELISFGKSECSIRADAFARSREFLLEISLAAGRRRKILINKVPAKKGGELTDKERFDTVNQVIRDITPENKVNLLIYDGDLFYAHTNFYETLFRLQKGETLVVATKPLTDDPAWEKVPMSTPLAYRKGKLVFEAEQHPYEFIDKEPRDIEYTKPL